MKRTIQLQKLELKDEDWITRAVVYSIECSERVVNGSIDFLNRKRKGPDIPHKIIAVAYSIKHDGN